jgi:hypothetical protein
MTLPLKVSRYLSFAAFVLFASGGMPANRSGSTRAHPSDER